MKSQLKIVLASQSPRRLELLTKARIQVEVIESPYIEEELPMLSPLELAKKHAFGKAKAVADIFEEGIIIGCDTVINLDGKTIGKPKDKEEATEILQLQQGRTIEVISGLSIIDAYKDRLIISHEVTKVKFHPMTPTEIEWYVNQKEWEGKSGAFAIQGIASRYIASVEGDFSSVIGIPVQKVYQTLRNWSYEI